MSSDSKQTIARCSFCSRPRNEVKAMVQGPPGVYLCNKCTQQAWNALQVDFAQTEAAKGKKEKPLLKPREIKAILDDHVIAQSQAKEDVAVAIYNHYKRREANKAELSEDLEGVVPQKSNIVLLGPSGTGKTEIARTVAKLLNVPFYVGDATRLTQAGYVGDDVETLLQGIIQAADGDIARAEWGIIMLDEIDKIARKSGRGATGFRDVTGEGVQQALLKLLEGSKVVVPRGMGTKMLGQGGESDVIDTTNILFIGAGSFAGIEEYVEKRLNKGASLGFGATAREKITPSDIYRNATEDDVLDFGLIPELMGRMPVLTTTLELTEEEMVRILTEPKNAIIKQVRALYAMDKIDLRFDEDALRAIGRIAKKKPTGARALRSIVEQVLRPYSFTAPSDPTIRSIRITEECVEKQAEAIIIRTPNVAVG